MNTPTMQPPHADDYASAVVIIGQLYAANMALVAGQAKAHAAGYDDAIHDAVRVCNRGDIVRAVAAGMHIAALSLRGQDHEG